MNSIEHVEPDDVFECLADGNRRAVVAELRDRGDSSLRDLAGCLTDTGDRTERIEQELHHRHLPKLADAGLVEYDPKERAIAPTERTAAADIVARTVEQCGVLCPDAEAASSERARLE